MLDFSEMRRLKCLSELFALMTPEFLQNYSYEDLLKISLCLELIEKSLDKEVIQQVSDEQLLNFPILLKKVKESVAKEVYNHFKSKSQENG